MKRTSGRPSASAAAPRFSIGGKDGFRLLDMGLNRVTVFGAMLGANSGILPSFDSSGTGGTGGAEDEFAVELTSLPGLSVDADLLNRRRYIDVTYVAPVGTDVDHDSIDASDFTLAGTGVADAEVDRIEWLEGDTFRYYLEDKDDTNEDRLFTAGDVQLTFAAGSWANTKGQGSPAKTFNVTVRDGAATGTKPMSAGPLTITGPHIGIEDFQYKMVDGGAHLTVTVGIGADAASLDFGGGQSSSGVSVTLTGLLGTFDVGATVTAAGLSGLTAAFGFQVDQLDATVPNVVEVRASDIRVNFPEKDTDDNREIITVDSASIKIPKVGVTGSITGLSVRNNGFSLGTAMLTKGGPIDLGGILDWMTCGSA